MESYFIFVILPAALALAYTLYLMRMNFNPSKRKIMMRKYEKGTLAYELYAKLYSPRFLASWTLITAFFVINVAFNAYKKSHHPSLTLLCLVLVSSISASLLGAYLISKEFKKK